MGCAPLLHVAPAAQRHRAHRLAFARGLRPLRHPSVPVAAVVLSDAALHPRPRRLHPRARAPAASRRAHAAPHRDQPRAPPPARQADAGVGRLPPVLGGALVGTRARWASAERRPALGGGRRPAQRRRARRAPRRARRRRHSSAPRLDRRHQCARCHAPLADGDLDGCRRRRRAFVRARCGRRRGGGRGARAADGAADAAVLGGGRRVDGRAARPLWRAGDRRAHGPLCSARRAARGGGLAGAFSLVARRR
mmetsp:Transcript_70767/g.212906  ORF Transcript_70767/g.212906 Transcript_70767/m.212906 type:complete len:251 (+) Transcript_70767:346-1098(+)